MAQLQDPSDYGSDENGWKDGLVAHWCGFFIEDHQVVDGKSVCPSFS